MNSHEANPIKRTAVLGYPVDLVDKDQAFTVARKHLDEKDQLHIVTLNPIMIINAQKDQDLTTSIMESKLIVPDGAGIILALFLNKIKLSNTTPGIELAEKCIQYCAEKSMPVALLGSRDDVVNAAVLKLTQKYPGLTVSFKHDGFYQPEEEEKMAQDISKTNPSLLLIALGVPKQEIWIKKYKHLFQNTVLIGVGGSFDVWSGKVKRAPAFFRILKMEWFYRLVTEPYRAKRIFTTLPYFVWQVLMNLNRKESE